jgi:uncharacterized protein DUF6600/FecR-like protein
LDGERWFMKNRFIASLAVLTLALGTILTMAAQAQTTEEGPGPSEQPNAPFEIGQPGNDQSAIDQPAIDQPESNQPEPSGEQAAQTDQGVARISMIHGDVSTQRGDSGDWSAATLNAPVVSGDKVSTGDDARTELQLDYANVLRLGRNTQANIATLTKTNIQIQLGQGLAEYSVFKDGQAEPEIDTPNVSIHPAHQEGVFRVEVQPDGDTLVIVRKGEVQISTPQGSTEVRSGEMATVRGTSTDAQYKISDAPGRDDWDRWNTDRDRLIHNAQAWHHTNRYYTGSEDLDAYGRWQNVPDYGDVWVPSESADWAPYRDGNWVYEPYYGWTWVGYEPWGWAPYHYGRWMLYGSSWAWWPGPVSVGYYPLWAPAYVSFFGWGGGWGFGVGFGGWGGFGWLPIGPCDGFHPWWGGYRNSFNVVNVTNITTINNFHGGIGPLHSGTRFSNLARINDPHVGRALSIVGARRFGAGPIRPVAATPQQIRSARMMTGNLPVVPTHASLSASGRAAAPPTIRSGGQQRFFGRTSVAARPASFQQQTASLQQSMQRSHVTSVQAGGGMNASGSLQARGAATTGAMQKPNAGIAPNRGQVNSPMARSGNQSVSPQGSQGMNRGGFRPFNPPSSSNARPSGPVSTPAPRSSFGQSASSNGNRGGFRPFSPPSVNTRGSGPSSMAPQRSMGSSAPSGYGNSGSFRPFNPPSHTQAPQSMAPTGRNNGGSYWNRTAPSSSGSRESNFPSRSYGSSRPQLDMRQPVVQPRTSSNYGGYRGSPSYSGRGYSAPSAPSYGGRGYSAPSAPSYGGGRPSYSGGGHSSYGGGRPSYGGGGGRAPSYGGGAGGHAPSGGGRPSGGGGGGSHSSGGGSHSGGRR